MSEHYVELMSTPAVRAVQRAHGSVQRRARQGASQGGSDAAGTVAAEAGALANAGAGAKDNAAAADIAVASASDRFDEREAQFIAAADSFYMASVAENGWPYLQHRGGPAGFLRVLGERLLGFADFGGNRQYLSVGNLGADDRAALFIMDYPRRRRLKILARVELRAPADDPVLAERLGVAGYGAKVERLMLLHLEAFDWNCPQHITARYSEAQLAEPLAPLQAQAGELQRLRAENAALRAALDTAARRGG